MRRALMVLGLILIPSLVGAGVYGLRRHVLLGRLAAVRAALGKKSATALLDQLVQAYPENAQAHFLRAQQFRLTNQDGPALESLKQAGELGWPRGLVNRERLLVLAHLDFRRMQKYLQLILDRNPLDRDVLLLLGQGYCRQASYDKAELIVRRWLDHRPDDCEALFLRGQIAVYARHWDQAVADLGRVVAGGPDQCSFEEARKLLASACLELGQFEEALRLFRECQTEEPENTAILYNIGQCASFLQRWDEAQAAFHEAIRLRPERDVLLKAAHVHEMRSEFAQALALLEKAENGDPRDVEVLASMARVLQALGKTERARAYRERYEQLKDLWTEVKVGAPAK